MIVDLDFSTLSIKGRQSQGNLFSRYGIHKIVLKERGTSTLGGQNVWFDEDVRRLNADGRGKLLGEFKGDDRIIVWTSKNQYYITGYDLGQHFPDETVRVSRYEPDRVYSVCYYDRSQQFYYMKRFTAEMSDKMQFFLDEDGQADLVAVTERTGAKLEITYKGAHASRPADEVDVDEFVGVKSHRAKGKRLTTYEVATLRFIEPELPPEPEPEPSDDDGGTMVPTIRPPAAAVRRAVRKPVPVTVRRAVRITVRSTVRTAMRLIAALSTPRPFPAGIRLLPPLLPSQIALLLLRLLPPRKIPQPRALLPVLPPLRKTDRPGRTSRLRRTLRLRRLPGRRKPRPGPTGCPVRELRRAGWSSRSNAPGATSTK